MADLKQFQEQLVNLTVKEVNELATILKDEELNQLLQL
jgi:large subunit ribosomal protein L7/L12